MTGKGELPIVADFATRLRELRKHNNLRQIDLANELGVAQTTIANYEQHSRFPDEETLGRIAEYFDVSLDYLLGRVDVNVSPRIIPHHMSGAFEPETTKEAERYLSLLLEGKKEEAFQFVLDLVRDGEAARNVYRNVLVPVLYEVGRRWERNEIDVSEEHYISAATVTLMGRLHPFFERTETKRGTVVALTAGGELHEIGIRMIADLLEEMGWDCYFLGSNTPTSSIYKALIDRNADILALSATMSRTIDSVANIISHVRNAQSQNGDKKIKVIVGGQAFSDDPDLALRIGADAHAPSADELKNLLDTLFDGE